LVAMGVSEPATNAFLDNAFYTPMDHTIIVSALAKMNGVANRGGFVIRASQARSRDLAVFIRHRAEMLADYHHRVEPFADFVEVRGVPLNRTRAGKVVAIVPFDQLVWTKQASDLVFVIDQDIRQRQLGTSIELRITGTATALARGGLRDRGWNVVENVSP